MSERLELFLEDHVDDHAGHDYAAAIEALLAAGILSMERAESWKAEHARLSASRHHFQGPYDEELEARAVELLEALFAPVRPLASDEWDPAVFQRYQEALSALRVIGALSLERARPWLEVQHATLTPPGGRPEPEPEPEMPFAAGELSAVLAGPAGRLDGMRVTSLELYGDCVIVRFHQLLPPEPADPVERRELVSSPFELEDEAGTPYRPALVPEPRGCRRREPKGWPEALVGWQAFVPGVPLDARTLTVGWRERRWLTSIG